MTDIIQYEGIENLGTTTDLINGKPIYDLDRIIETSGFTTAGDGGAGKWKQNGVTGQTPSQTPGDLGSQVLLNDGNGNQWEFVGEDLNQTSILKYCNISFTSVSEAISTSDNSVVNLANHIGEYIEVLDYYGGSMPNSSGVMLFQVVSYGSGVNDGGSFIDSINGQYTLKQLFKDAVYIEQFGASNNIDSRSIINKALSYASNIGFDTVASLPVMIVGSAGGDGKQRLITKAGYSVSGGGGIFNTSEFRQLPNKGMLRKYRNDLLSFDTVAYVDDVVNDVDAGYGVRLNYSTRENTTGFSVGHGIVADSDSETGQSLASWLVQSTPVSDVTNDWGVFCQEQNVINVAGDQGYNNQRSEQQRWTGCLQLVPEAKDLTRSGSRNTFNTLYGAVVAKSAGQALTGYHIKTYNGFLVEPNSIAENGCAITVNGNDGLDDKIPKSAFYIREDFEQGIDFTDSNFTNGDAIMLKTGQGVNIAGNKVLGDQQPAISDSTGTDSQQKINEILAVLRSHGLIST